MISPTSLDVSSFLKLGLEHIPSLDTVGPGGQLLNAMQDEILDTRRLT